MYPFGAKAYVHIPSDNCKKLDDRAKLCFLVGYLEDGRGWYFWDGGGNQFISSLVAEFVEYTNKPTLPNPAKKGTVEFMLNQISLELGKVPVEEICNTQDAMIENIPQISDLDIPQNLNHARKSP
jgi:hypothetical protein